MGNIHSDLPQVVKNTVVRLLEISNANNLSVKCKFKATITRKPKWCFVLYDDEEMLQALDAKWESVSLQTG